MAAKVTQTYSPEVCENAVRMVSERADNIPPAEAEERYYAQLEAMKIAK